MTIEVVGEADVAGRMQRVEEGGVMCERLAMRIECNRAMTCDAKNAAMHTNDKEE